MISVCLWAELLLTVIFWQGPVFILKLNLLHLFLALKHFLETLVAIVLFVCLSLAHWQNKKLAALVYTSVTVLLMQMSGNFWPTCRNYRI